MLTSWLSYILFVTLVRKRSNASVCELSRLFSAKIIIFNTFKWVFYKHATAKNNCRLPHVQQEILFKIEPWYLLRTMLR